MREELNDAMTDCKVEKLDIFSSEKIPERIEEICQKLSRSMFHESKTRGKMEPDNAIYQAAEYGHHNAIIGIGKWKMGVRQTGHPKKYEFNTLSGKEFEEGFSYFLRLRHPRFDKKYDRDSKSKRNGCEKSVDDVRVLLDLSSYTNLRDLDELVEGGIPHLYNEEDSLQSRLQMFDSTFAAYEKERYLPAMCLLVVQFWYDYWMVRKGQEMEDYGKVMGIDVKTEVSSLLAAEAEEVPAINDAKACDEKYRETYYGMHVKHLFKLKALKVLEEIREIISTSKNGQSGFATMTEEQANKLTCDLLCQLGHKLYIDNLTYGKSTICDQTLKIFLKYVTTVWRCI
mmetsp:Transcript_32168/g.52229  ORF Transcript_32168/g.52229 Transcript_32168/m.52229 type:complete len:342 (-) Transcript_32168:507-1532(-)